MNAEERIKAKKKMIEKCKERIAREQEKIKKLTEEIEEIESLEIKGLIKELDIPLSELKEFIKKIKHNSKISIDVENKDNEQENLQAANLVLKSEVEK